MLALILVGIGACVLMCGALQSENAQSSQIAASPAATNAPVPRGPTALWTYPGATQIHSMVLTPDGKHAFVSMTVKGINLWKLLVYYWPEWSGAILLVVLFWVIRRTSKHEQEPGQPHCRLCNYQLTNLDAKTCPECGGELTKRNRVMGTRKRWTLAALLATMALVVLAYMRFADSSQRGESMHRWFNWSSTWLEEWVKTEGWVWPSRGSDYAHRLVKIDLNHGTVVETTYEQLGRWALVRMLVSPSRNVLCGMDSWKGRVVFIDLDAGRDVVFEGNDVMDTIIQISLNESTATVYAVDQHSRVWRCDLAAPKWTHMPNVYSQTIEQWGVSLAATSSQAVVVDRRDSKTGMPLDHPTANVVDLQTGSIIATWQLEPRNWQPVEISDDGQWLFNQRSDGVVRVRQVASDETNMMEQPAVAASRSAMLAPNGRWIVTRGMTAFSIQIVDCGSDTLLADLMSPGNWPNDMDLDMNGRCLFECILDSADSQYKIAKYDLSDLMSEPPPSSSNAIGR